MADDAPPDWPPAWCRKIGLVWLCHGHGAFWVGCLSLLFAVASVWLGFEWRRRGACDATWKGLRYGVVAFWALATPVWFWAQWLTSEGPGNEHKWEDMKYGHEVSRNIWIALVIVLAVLYQIEWKGL